MKTSVRAIARPVSGRRWIGDITGRYWPQARWCVRVGRRVIGWTSTKAEALQWARELA